MAMRGVASLNINGRPHPVNVYVTAGEGTKKGVIHGIEPHTPSETIKASIRFHTQGVTLVDARMLGDSQSAVLTFFGDILPRYVYYRGSDKECIPFRNTIQFCRANGEVGHRTRRVPAGMAHGSETTQASPLLVPVGGRGIGMGVRMSSDPKESFQNLHAVEKECRGDRATRTAASKVDIDAESNLLGEYERASPSEKQATGGMPCT
ncbi:hypothetical protein MTO96_042103 [Rhipicephalus appendiculatus]